MSCLFINKGKRQQLKMQTAVDDPEERIKIFNTKKCQRHCRKSHCKNFSEGYYDVVKGEWPNQRHI